MGKVTNLKFPVGSGAGGEGDQKTIPSTPYPVCFSSGIALFQAQDPRPLEIPNDFFLVTLEIPLRF